jgi:germination protein M
MRRFLCIVAVCLIAAIIFSGCSVLQKLGLKKDESEELHPASSVVMGEEEAMKLTDKIPVRLYFANEDNTKLKLEMRYIPMSDARKNTSHLASVIIRELIKGPGPDSNAKAVIPPGTQLRGPVAVEAGVATVDFSKEFIEKRPEGKAEEQMIIFSIVNSLTELKDIQKVKFLIDGKARKEYGGNFQFDAPFQRSPSLISKDFPEPSSISTEEKDKEDAKEGAGDKEQKDGKSPEADKAKETSGEPEGDPEETYLELDDFEETYLELEEGEPLE